MFDFLKKKLSLGVKKLSEKAEKKKDEEKLEKKKKIIEKPVVKEERKALEVEKKEKIIEKPISEKEIKPEKETRGLRERIGLRKIKEKIVERKLTEKDIEDFFEETESGFLQANVALSVVDSLKNYLNEELVQKQVKRGGGKEAIIQAFEDSLYEIVNQGSIDLEKLLQEKKPVNIVFLGFNGSGKTTSIAKVAKYLQNKKHRPLLAAADTFRAASIEQIEYHAEKLGIKLIKHKYGADPAAVVFDAIKHAEKAGYDFVLADTAGRMHTDKNLMDELKKIVRVNSPDLKVLVVDSLTGNDAVEQAKKFNDAVGVDAVILTKVDVNEKGGSILSVCHSIKKPILFLGVGQGYEDLVKFEPKKFVKSLLE